MNVNRRSLAAVRVSQLVLALPEGRRAPSGRGSIFSRRPNCRLALTGRCVAFDVVEQRIDGSKRGRPDGYAIPTMLQGLLTRRRACFAHGQYRPREFDLAEHQWRVAEKGVAARVNGFGIAGHSFLMAQRLASAGEIADGEDFRILPPKR